MSSLSYKSPLSRQITGLIFFAIAVALFYAWQAKDNSIFLVACVLMAFIGFHKSLTMEETVFKEGEPKAKKRTLFMGFKKVEEQCEFDVVDMMCNDHMLGRWQVYVTQSDEMMRRTLSPEQFKKIKDKEEKQLGFVAIDGLSNRNAKKAIADIKKHCGLVEIEVPKEKSETTHLNLLPHQEEWELERKNAHPKAVALLDSDFYWDFVNEEAPLGNDTGAEVLIEYSKVFAEDPELDDFQFLQTCFQRITEEKEKISEVTDDIKERFSQESADTVLGLCFASFLLKGEIHPQIKTISLQSVENRYAESPSDQLKDIASKIEQM